MVMYFETADGVLRCRRGTSAVEGYHSQYHHAFHASFYSPAHFLLRRLAFNHSWNTKAGIANAGEKDWGTSDWRELEKLQAICLQHGLANPIPELSPVRRLSPEQKRSLDISKLPLEAAEAMGAYIPASCKPGAPAPAVIQEDSEAAFCKWMASCTNTSF
jgi:hypothetical protein